MNMVEESRFSAHRRYFSKDEIENHAPSRKDGIDMRSEAHLRKLYCSFLQEIGIKLKVPQVTIASAMLLCHRFYMSQSHAKNDWQTIATVCIFLACKVEETPRFLNDVVVVSYEIMHKWDPSASRRIRQREVFDKQKEVILLGERLLLSTIAFDLNIQLPYKPLVTALKRLDIFPDLAKVAWNFVNDWLGTTLCLQYKPHYIAAGSLFLAAKLQKVKLPTEKGRVWWLEFDVSLKQLEEVIQEMRRLLGQDRKQPLPSSNRRSIQSKASVGKPLENSSQSCISSESVADCQSSHRYLVEDRGSKEYSATRCHNNLAEDDNYLTACKTSDSGSTSRVVEGVDGEIQLTIVDTDQKTRSNVFRVQNYCCKLDVTRIKDTLKKRKCNGVVKKPLEAVSAEANNEAWIESELENGIDLGIASVKKRQRRLL
ncbi:Cyclin [Trema orientale]|uniref:B-like cyclin n=1 Tax=Trema orientale TaxID=63057 RepID=A0A2P5F6H9_TREOI|nr:Cyclin [Trema orientale]